MPGRIRQTSKITLQISFSADILLKSTALLTSPRFETLLLTINQPFFVYFECSFLNSCVCAAVITHSPRPSPHGQSLYRPEYTRLTSKQITIQWSSFFNSRTVPRLEHRSPVYPKRSGSCKFFGTSDYCRLLHCISINLS